MTLNQLIALPTLTASEYAILARVSKPTARKQIKLINEKNNYCGNDGHCLKNIPVQDAIKELRVDLDFHRKNGTMDTDLEDKPQSKSVKKKKN